MPPITWQWVVTLVQWYLGRVAEYVTEGLIPRVFINTIFLVLRDPEVQGLASDKQKRLVVLMVDAVRYTNPEAFSKEQIRALQACASYLGSSSITKEDLARCDETLQNAGLDSLPGIPDD